MRVTATHQPNSQGTEEQGYCMEGDDDFTATQEGQVADFGSLDGLNNTESGKKELELIKQDGKISQEEADALNKKKKIMKDSGNFSNGQQAMEMGHDDHPNLPPQ